MAQVNMSEYRITKEDGTTVIAVRDSSIPVAQDFEGSDNPITQIQRTRTGINVSLPDTPTPVYFTVNVTPDAAFDGKCIAAPRSFTVLNGTPVLFEAIPAPGFVFVGWFLNAPIMPEDADTFDPAEPVSTDLKATIVITSPAPGQQRAVEARFAPSP